MLAPPASPAQQKQTLTPLGRLQLHRQRPVPAVLVVDDDADSLMLISYVLEQFKCSFFFETNGQAALQLAHQLKPELIVLDILLPGLSGLEVVQALRRDRATASTPVIAVTAMAGTWDQERAIRAGCSHYLSKPYLLEDMTHLLSCYLTPNC